mmetsp:Transcript_6671/g.21586  ORF Transcript_6671/g.21586 Transcript_6671/m.21586 type:complete len:351 (+) Transcript_6671:252-1304(+)
MMTGVDPASDSSSSTWLSDVASCTTPTGRACLPATPVMGVPTAAARSRAATLVRSRASAASQCRAKSMSNAATKDACAASRLTTLLSVTKSVWAKAPPAGSASDAASTSDASSESTASSSASVCSSSLPATGSTALTLYASDAAARRCAIVCPGASQSAATARPATTAARAATARTAGPALSSVAARTASAFAIVRRATSRSLADASASWTTRRPTVTASSASSRVACRGIASSRRRMSRGAVLAPAGRVDASEVRRVRSLVVSVPEAAPTSDGRLCRVARCRWSRGGAPSSCSCSSRWGTMRPTLPAAKTMKGGVEAVDGDAEVSGVVDEEVEGARGCADGRISRAPPD